MTATLLTPFDLATTYAKALMRVDFSAGSWKLVSIGKRLGDAFHAPLRVLPVDTEAHCRDAGDIQRIVHVSPCGESIEVDDAAGRDAATGIVRALGDDESSLLVIVTQAHPGIAELAPGGTAW